MLNSNLYNQQKNLKFEISEHIIIVHTLACESQSNQILIHEKEKAICQSMQAI